ncbi:hypothetical protein HSBAA_12060 [Vreelandella sulfidaeris]|uniref:Uncharacterized protein n=1 Tax=Vreelandella sulfidaeris TaxID=115553 RepID=A0A455U1M9_9GAMM|nr:hypothetical protein HSBAA_12060 [Halomonas sulfidaeris]
MRSGWSANCARFPASARSSRARAWHAPNWSCGPISRAADLGVTSAAIAETLRVATLGDYDQDLAKLNLSERQVPIVVRLADAAREDLQTLKQLPVPGARGAVPLENVATLEIGSGPSQITRYDRMRNINFEVELNGRELGEGGTGGTRAAQPADTTAGGDAGIGR